MCVLCVLQCFSHVHLFVTLWTVARLLCPGDSPGKILEQVVMTSSWGSYRPKDQTCISYVSCIGRQVLYDSATWEVLSASPVFSFNPKAFLRCRSEKAMATHSSVLAWRTPGTGEPGGLLPMGSHRVGHD